MKLSENLYRLRKRDKITQEELADRLNVSRQSVSKWETGEAYPETDKLLVLCDLFGVSLDTLMRGEITEEKQERKTDDGEYVAHMNKFSRKIAVGVFLVLLGVAVCMVFSGISCIFSKKVAELFGVLGGVSVLLFVAVSVFLFVFSGMEHERFCKEHPVTEKTFDERETKAFGKRFAVIMSCLVSGILLDVIFLVVFSSLIDADIIATSNKDATYCFVTAVFMGVLSFIVGGLTYYGMQHDKFDTEKYNKQNGSTVSSRAKVKDAICGIVMLTATAAFLVVGFVWGKWHPGWVAFPVGGILCAIVNIVADAKNGKNRYPPPCNRQGI